MQQTAVTTAIEVNVQPQEKIMKAAQVFSFTLIGIGMLGAGSVLADDLPLPADPVQQREQMRGMSAEDRTAYRDQMQERMRSMTPEEQKLMRDTRADGRARVESSANEETRQRSRDGSGQGRGQGGGKGGGMGGGGRGRS
jgi:hypothetical protein